MRSKHEDREQRRIETTKARHGADFFPRNARKAGRATPTKFNSQTGRAAAFRKHELDRIRKSEQQDQIKEAK